MPANKKYKDSVFTLLFKDKEKLINLYNGIEGTNYSPDTPIEINTLENALMNGRMNDISFVLDGKIVVFIEHQSTINPNMPLRMLLYVGRIYEKIMDNKAIYSKLLVKIPTPEFYVMYNGIEKYPIDATLKLSDAYMIKKNEEESDLELVVKVLNINYSEKNEVLKRVEVLNEYSQFIEKVREFQKAGITLDEAIKKAIRYCIKEGILKEFLEKHGSEVENMLFTEWNYETEKEVIRNDGITIGMQQGKREGKLEAARNFLALGLSTEQVSKGTGLSIEEVRKLTNGKQTK